MDKKDVDVVTVLQAVGTGKFYGKRFVDGKAYIPKEYIEGVQSGERPYWHRVTQEKITGLEGFAQLHARFRNNKRVCIIRNRPLKPHEKGTLTRVNGGYLQYVRQKKNFIDEGRHWVMFDFDNAQCKKFDWQKDPEMAALETIHRFLPKTFRQADFFWFYSASQGITKGFKKETNLHIVFWMDRPVSNLEWRAWITQHDLDRTLSDCVDESLFNDTQPHYITDPILKNTPDPFTNLPRSGIRQGKKQTVEFVLDASYVAPPEVGASVYQSDDIFDVVERFEKSEEAKAFNKYIKIHEVLQRFGFIVKMGSEVGTPLDKKYQCRYLDPHSESGVAGVGVTTKGELHSFHESGLFRPDKFYDAFETYLLLAEFQRREDMAAIGMGFDEFNETFTEEAGREVDPEEALSAIDAAQDFENADSPLLVARVKAHKLTVRAGLRWLNKHYFLLTQDTENVFNSYKTLDPNRGKELFYHRKTKVVDLLGYKFQNSYIERDDDGNQILVSRPVNLTKTFLSWSGHRHFDDVGLYFGRAGAAQLDLWEGYAVEPHSGDWSAMAYHMREVMCGGDLTKYEYLLDLLASWIQNPDEKYGVAIVLVGDKGTGKNAFFDFLAKLYSPAQVLVDSNPDTFFGSFNSLLMGKVLIGLDEVGFGGDHVTGRKLKTLVTSPSLVINRKGVPAINTNNHTHLVFMSNELWAVQTSRDERRFFILKMSNIHQQESAYFKKLFEIIQDRRVQAAFLADMKGREVERNVREVVRTETLKDMAVFSESVVIRWLMDMLDYGILHHIRGQTIEYLVDKKGYSTQTFYERIWHSGNHPSWGEFVPSVLLREDFQIYCDKNKVTYRGSMGVLSHEITEVFGYRSKQVWSKQEEEGEGRIRQKYSGFDFPLEVVMKEALGQEAPKRKSEEEIVEEALKEFQDAGLVLVGGKG